MWRACVCPPHVVTSPPGACSDVVTKALLHFQRDEAWRQLSAPRGLTVPPSDGPSVVRAAAAAAAAAAIDA
jgi:hypothetical protein